MHHDGVEHDVPTLLAHVIDGAGLRKEHPPEVMREVEALVADPGVGDPSLADWTSRPFVTIDGPTSKDLDQALFVERAGGVFRVHYAIADAAYFAPAKSATFREALARGASYYLPSMSVPMLPRELSEGVASLNEGVRRRALVFSTDVDDDGRARATAVTRAVIRSVKKLAFGEVQAFYDTDAGPLAAAPFAASLRLLREVGRLRVADLADRDVARFRRRETALVVEGGRLVAKSSPRLDVELYNEQLSILCNREGARLLYAGEGPRVQPIYRVHPAPESERLADFATLTQAIAAAHGLPADPWAWGGPSSPKTLAGYLAALPDDPARQGVLRALHRQAIMVNARSSFAVAPQGHFGVGADLYARFSAPMREIVGVFCHKELCELLDGKPATDAERRADEELRALVVEAANASKQTQRKLNDLVSRIALDQAFEADLARPEGKRPLHAGTVMGLSSSKVHVELDAPSLDVKLYFYDLGQLMGGAWLDLDEGGASVRVRGEGRVVMRVGDRVELSVVGREKRTDRWVLRPVGFR